MRRLASSSKRWRGAGCLMLYRLEQRPCWYGTTGREGATTGTAETSAAPASRVSPSVLKVKKIVIDKNEGISEGLGGFGHYAGSITAFMDPNKKKTPDGPLPCEQLDGQNAPLPSNGLTSPFTPGKGPLKWNTAQQMERMQAEDMAAVVEKGGPLPSPRRQGAPSSPPQIAAARPTPDFLKGSALPPLPSPISRQPSAASSPSGPSSLPKNLQRQTANIKVEPDLLGTTPNQPTSLSSKEAEDYYRSLPKQTLTKEEMWARIQAANADKSERQGIHRKPATISGGGAKAAPEVPETAALTSHEVDYAKMEEDLKEYDPWHYQLGAYAFRADGVEESEAMAQQRRYDYYTMWTLAMSLNKARWNLLEVNAQRGVKTTGAGMKILFWKEAVRGVLQSGSTSGASFTDSHPVLRPFASMVSRHPKITKSFIRGFTDARLRTIQQPANMQQLFDHFDKFYGYFYNTLLEATNLQDEAAEHALLHIGRANGITNHCVMFWKKYATLGVTMLPADLCADHCVHLGLLKRIGLASRDRAVRRLLCDVMGVAKTEMLQAEKLAKDIHPKTWPILMECFYPNYYLNFLQKRDFNVSAMFADYNIENMGFTWFRLKKRWEWERTQSVEKLLSDAAPVPIINRCIFYRGTAYKMATPARGSTENTGNSPAGVRLAPSKLG